MEIADAYQKQYPDLVKVIHKENGGHGSGVNAGLACARGVYFKVVDSDDWLDGTAYQKLLEKIRYYCKEAGRGEEKPDLFVCNYVYNHLEQQITRSMGYGNVFPAEKSATGVRQGISCRPSIWSCMPWFTARKYCGSRELFCRSIRFMWTICLPTARCRMSEIFFIWILICTSIILAGMTSLSTSRC